MIRAFDLDGVFLSDTNFDVCRSESEYLELRKTFVNAIFVPKGDYVIITGRPLTDYPHTKGWIDKHLSYNPPKELYHQNVLGIDKAKFYKEQVLEELCKENKVKFVESCPIQFRYLQSLDMDNLTVYLFSDIITQTM